jgi:hypothetical protein
MPSSWLQLPWRLPREIGSSILGLADILGELKNTLALAFVASSGIGKAVAQVVDLLSNGTNGGLVVLLGPLQAITLLLQLLISSGNRVLQSRSWR